MHPRRLSFVIAVFVLLSALPLSAQQFHGGLTAGLVGSQMAGDTYSGYKKAGIYAGGYVGLDLTPRSSLQMELTYFQKGSRENPREKNNYDYYLLRMDYVELPLLYQYKTGKNKKFIIQAGPSMGVNVGYFEEDETEIISDYTDNTPARITFQINVGLRWMVSEHLGVDFRSNNSLLNVRSKNVNGDVWRLWGYGQFHDALVLSAFYQFK